MANINDSNGEDFPPGNESFLIKGKNLSVEQFIAELEPSTVHGFTSDGVFVSALPRGEMQVKQKARVAAFLASSEVQGIVTKTLDGSWKIEQELNSQTLGKRYNAYRNSDGVNVEKDIYDAKKNVFETHESAILQKHFSTWPPTIIKSFDTQFNGLEEKEAQQKANQKFEDVIESLKKPGYATLSKEAPLPIQNFIREQNDKLAEIRVAHLDNPEKLPEAEQKHRAENIEKYKELIALAGMQDDVDIPELVQNNISIEDEELSQKEEESQDAAVNINVGIPASSADDTDRKRKSDEEAEDELAKKYTIVYTPPRFLRQGVMKYLTKPQDDSEPKEMFSITDGGRMTAKVSSMEVAGDMIKAAQAKGMNPIKIHCHLEDKEQKKQFLAMMWAQAQAARPPIEVEKYVPTKEAKQMLEHLQAQQRSNSNAVPEHMDQFANQSPPGSVPSAAPPPYPGHENVAPPPPYSLGGGNAIHAVPDISTAIDDAQSRIARKFLQALESAAEEGAKVAKFDSRLGSYETSKLNAFQIKVADYLENLKKNPNASGVTVEKIKDYEEFINKQIGEISKDAAIVGAIHDPASKVILRDDVKAAIFDGDVMLSSETIEELGKLIAAKDKKESLSIGMADPRTKHPLVGEVVAGDMESSHCLIKTGSNLTFSLASRAKMNGAVKGVYVDVDKTGQVMLFSDSNKKTEVSISPAGKIEPKNVSLGKSGSGLTGSEAITTGSSRSGR